MAVTRTDLSDIDLLDPDAFVAQKHHEWFRRLRDNLPRRKAYSRSPLKASSHPVV